MTAADAGGEPQGAHMSNGERQKRRPDDDTMQTGALHKTAEDDNSNDGHGNRCHKMTHTEAEYVTV